MDSNLVNISKIETFFNALLDNKVSDNTFFTVLPPVIEQEWTDMVVVDCGNAISDLNAFGSGNVLVWIYGKPMSTGAKPVKRMSQLETKLNERIAANTDEHYVISRRETYADYDDARNLFVNIVVLNLLIK